MKAIVKKNYYFQIKIHEVGYIFRKKLIWHLYSWKFIRFPVIYKAENDFLRSQFEFQNEKMIKEKFTFMVNSISFINSIHE